MYRTLTIGEKEINMLSNAYTPILFKNVFRRDLLSIVATFEGLDEKSGYGELYDFAVEVGFCMAKQAECSIADLMKVNYQDFITWMSGFKSNDFLNADTISEIISVWQESQETTSDPK